jgi:hypothetical protein
MQQANATALLSGHYHCPDDFASFSVMPDLSPMPDYFQFGPGITCYGQCSSGVSASLRTGAVHDARPHVRIHDGLVLLPFDPVQVVNNLRLERYTAKAASRSGKRATRNVVQSLYYSVRPFMSVAVRKHLQNLYLRGWERIPFPSWPVDRTVENIFEQLLILGMDARNIDRLPFIWFWPDGNRSCAMLTHDVETRAGADFCPQLMDLNDSFGIKSSFQLVPEGRYALSPTFLENIRARGFEVNVHDLNHDGRLFSDRAEFLRRAERIKRYAQEYGTLGFRSAVLYRNADWCDALSFCYDMSTPNVAHLDPQRGGCCTVFPFFIGNTLELPVTTTQDYSLFHILKDYSIRLWKQQIALIREKHGLISFIIHPDYVIEHTARRVYTELLEYLSELRARGEIYTALPGEIAAWWKMRSGMKLVASGGSWQIAGKGSERARVAYAVRVNDTLVYEMT